MAALASERVVILMPVEEKALLDELEASNARAHAALDAALASVEETRRQPSGTWSRHVAP